jgi:hypothetical protein
MNGLEVFLRAHGLWAVFFAAAFEGDITLLLHGKAIGRAPIFSLDRSRREYNN